MRKQIIGSPAPTSPTSRPDDLDLTAIATVQVSSEDSEHPIENAFDGQQGPGASRWRAAQAGEQQVILVFDTPQDLGRICMEVEEGQTHRTQEVVLEVSWDGGRHYQDVLRQEYTFSPPGTTFEREVWRVEARNVTHLRLRIQPDKGGGPCRASLTTLALGRL